MTDVFQWAKIACQDIISYFAKGLDVQPAAEILDMSYISHCKVKV